MGSLSDRGVGSADCYAKPANTSCQLGYWERNGGCCFGVDGQLDVSHPLHFGFDEFVATPECAASATTNCGCFFWPTPHNDTPCELGHYHKGPGHTPYNECMQYYVGNATVVDAAGHSDPAGLQVEPIDHVSSVDDEAYLVDQFEALLGRSTAARRPFLAVIAFHGAHIPYVATPATRATYPGMTTNEQDYWGTVTQIDAAVGRVRQLLQSHGVAERTWVSITADNGPEVDPAGGQGTGTYPNPGRTGGLRGRKRDVTEGGTRVIGLVEYPRAAMAVNGGRVEARFPVSTMDIMPTLLDALGQAAPRTLDGVSLLPYLRGEAAERDAAAGIGIHGIFRFGSTNHQNGSFPDICPNASDAVALGDVPADFSTPGNQPQWSWAEGNHLKIFGCRGHCDGTNCNSTSPGYRNEGWHFYLYNLTADRAEQHDLWSAQRAQANAMLGRFLQWQASVLRSQGPDENACNPPTPSPPPPSPPLPVKALDGMQGVKQRCAAGGGNHISTVGGRSVSECAWHCHDATGLHGGFRAAPACHFFSFSDGCNECWLFGQCDPPRDHDEAWLYNWSTFELA